MIHQLNPRFNKYSIKAIPTPLWTSEKIPLWRKVIFGHKALLPKCTDCGVIFKNIDEYRKHYRKESAREIVAGKL